MQSNGTLTLVQSIYDHVHLALWATLAAFVAFFVAFVAPRLPQTAARAEALRIQEIAQENEGYCAKWALGLRCTTSAYRIFKSFDGRLRTDLPIGLSFDCCERPKGGHWFSVSRCPLCAKGGHEQSQQNSYSINRRY
jgi:hypothetical protein